MGPGMMSLQDQFLHVDGSIPSMRGQGTLSEDHLMGLFRAKAGKGLNVGDSPTGG